MSILTFYPTWNYRILLKRYSLSSNKHIPSIVYIYIYTVSLSEEHDYIVDKWFYIILLRQYHTN